MGRRRVDRSAILSPARKARFRASDDLRHASRAVWRRVHQNRLYPAIPRTGGKALDLPRPGTNDSRVGDAFTFFVMPVYSLAADPAIGGTEDGSYKL